MTVEEWTNKTNKELEKELEDKDLQSLKAYAIANGANNDEVNACKDKPCVFAIIMHLKISKQFQELVQKSKKVKVDYSS